MKQKYTIPFRCSCCGVINHIASTADEESYKEFMHVFCPVCLKTTDVAFLWNNKQFFQVRFTMNKL